MATDHHQRSHWLGFFIIANWANDSKVFLISSMYSNTAKRAYMEVMESWWKQREGGMVLVAPPELETYKILLGICERWR